MPKQERPDLGWALRPWNKAEEGMLGEPSLEDMIDVLYVYTVIQPNKEQAEAARFAIRELYPEADIAKEYERMYPGGEPA